MTSTTDRLLLDICGSSLVSLLFLAKVTLSFWNFQFLAHSCAFAWLDTATWGRIFGYLTVFFSLYLVNHEVKLNCWDSVCAHFLSSSGEQLLALNELVRFSVACSIKNLLLLYRYLFYQVLMVSQIVTLCINTKVLPVDTQFSMQS